MTDLEFYERLAADVEEWKRLAHPPSLLYSSNELAQAINYVREQPVNEEEWKFIEMSIRRDVPAELVAVMSSEFRTALTSIKGFCELLLIKEHYGALTQGQREPVKHIQRLAEHVESALNAYLDDYLKQWR